MAGLEQRVRFVVLHHTGVVPEHFDLMVQMPGEEMLRTWRIVASPSTWKAPPSNPPTAERLADHRAAYLMYEGAVSGNRGQVKRVAEGEAVVGEEGGWLVMVLESLSCTLHLRLAFHSK